MKHLLIMLLAVHAHQGVCWMKGHLVTPWMTGSMTSVPMGGQWANGSSEGSTHPPQLQLQQGGAPRGHCHCQGQVVGRLCQSWRTPPSTTRQSRWCRGSLVEHWSLRRSLATFCCFNQMLILSASQIFGLCVQEIVKLFPLHKRIKLAQILTQAVLDTQLRAVGECV